MNDKSRSPRRYLPGTLIPMGFLALGCPEERPDPTCDEVADHLYEEDWELWCESYGATVYVYTCGWYDDNDPANFSESQAEDICEQLADLAEDERCEPEFSDAINCLAAHADDPEDCEDQWSDLLECVF